ncbi:hypothetical protein [Cupriavidus sp. H18C1]|uniref:hypothetical protein n=1 Tax=Cupriavidus sp. H18C1 TaxID=3241601 RepID=UPI003BB898E4
MAQHADAAFVRDLSLWSRGDFPGKTLASDDLQPRGAPVSALRGFVGPRGPRGSTWLHAVARAVTLSRVRPTGRPFPHPSEFAQRRDPVGASVSVVATASEALVSSTPR